MRRFARVLLLGGGLPALIAVAQTPPPGPDLSAQFDSAVQAFMEEYRAADESARPALLEDPRREPRHRFTPLFQAEAEKRKGTPEALPYWTWLADNGSIVDPRVGDDAAARLLADHLASPDLGPGAKAIGRSAAIRGKAKVIPELTRIVDRSPHSSVRAEALFQRALLLRRDTPAAARRDLKAAATMAPESAAGKRAAAELEATAPPTVGKPAPRLEGKSLADERVTLAGLSGRVVLVDFWGMWCGPCVADLPKLKRLRARFAKDPVTLLSVDTDKDPDALRRFLAANEIDWVNVLDGQRGPVTTAWGVSTFPTIYLVDEKGVIRAHNLPYGRLEARIDELLKAARARPSP